MIKRNGFAILGIFLASMATWMFAPTALSDETAIVYSVFKGIDLGNPNDRVQKDYFVNLGTNQGIHVGTLLEVARKAPAIQPGRRHPFMGRHSHVPTVSWRSR